MKTLKRGLPLALLAALAACSSPAAAPAEPTADDGGAVGTQAPATATTDAGNGADGGGDLAGYDLCDAASEEEVSQITGAAVADSTAATSSGVLSCNYNSATTAVAGTTLTGGDAGVDPQAFFDSNRTAEGAEEIPGLGDAAVMAGDEDFPLLMVMVDGRLLSLTVLAENLDGAGKREATIELARLAVDRLP